jgi:ribosomal 50S subunit-recycling heat shock protein
MGGRARATVAAARAALVLAAAPLLLAACGDEDFENKARPPVRLQLSGVIQKDKVTVSPSHDLGAGPIELTISNQTGDRHTVEINGGSTTQPAQPVDAGDTLTIKRTLDADTTYRVVAGGEKAVRKEIAPATLEVGTERRDSNSDLMLP